MWAVFRGPFDVPRNELRSWKTHDMLAVAYEDSSAFFILTLDVQGV